ncbi:hypothetical protein [Iamia sp.]|jgi:predicted transcriptional regulator|uniref:hypothetical protein n=1 Tax=Iamia sp. TaxID=2722710 RepID=UPI002C472F3F|nr:hypothetical protein [Iamia sp.]HXH56139.1 hypothetical protein [Iamia sp.]
MSTTIRVSEQTRDRVAAIAARTERPMTAVLDDALDALERRVFFADFNDGWGRLRSDASAWAEIEAERNLEARALPDGGY